MSEQRHAQAHQPNQVPAYRGFLTISNSLVHSAVCAHESVQHPCRCCEVDAADEEQFEGRNVEDSDMRSEATGTTEEDLRPVKVS